MKRWLREAGYGWPVKIYSFRAVGFEKISLKYWAVNQPQATYSTS